MIAAVFAMQPLGQLCAYAAGLTALATFGSSKVEVDKQWRYVVGIGGIPTLLALGFRLSMPEGGRYRYDVRGISPAPAPPMPNGHIDHRTEPDYTTADVQSINGDLQLVKKPFFVDLREFLFVDGHWRDLFGTSVCWFLLDFAFCEYKTRRPHVECQGNGGKTCELWLIVFPPPRWTRLQQSRHAGKTVGLRASQVRRRMHALLVEDL